MKILSSEESNGHITSDHVQNKLLQNGGTLKITIIKIKKQVRRNNQKFTKTVTIRQWQ